MSLKEFDSGSGATMPDETPVSGPTFGIVPLAAIVPSLTNRKRFNEEKMRDLVASIRASGVHQPILLRPLPGSRVQETSVGMARGQQRPEFEIVAGERRWKASQLAEMPGVPAIVKNMSDREALEVQLVENLQREDLHPIEEAEGYERLMKETGISAADIGAKVGKGRTSIYNTLELLKLCSKARDVFYDGGLDKTKAQLIAGVPDEKLQLKTLTYFTTADSGGRMPSYRECREWLMANVMLRLEHAPFDTKQINLIADVPSCATCPKRTGANPDLFADFNSPDLCTDPSCYGKKATAELEALQRFADAAGQKLIAGKEAKELMRDRHSGVIKGYTRLDQRYTDSAGVNRPTLKSALGRDAPKPIIFVNPYTQERLDVLPTNVVEELLAKNAPAKAAPKDDRTMGLELESPDAKGHSKPIGTPAPPAASPAAAKAEADKGEQIRKYQEAWRMRAAKSISAAVAGGALHHFSGPVLRRILIQLLDSDVMYAVEGELVQLWQLPADCDIEGIERHIEAAPEENLGRYILDVLTASEVRFFPASNPDQAVNIELIAADAGVDLAEIRAEVKAELLPKPRKAPAAPQASAPPGPAAPQGSVAAKGGKAAKTPKGAPAGKQKLSAKDAQLGIAEAMQGIDGPAGGVWVTPAALYRVGQKVRFKQGLKTAGGKSRKVSGREGTIEKIIQGTRYSVRFGRELLATATANHDELEMYVADVKAPA